LIINLHTEEPEHSHRREHVIYASVQVNATIVASPVGKIDEIHNLNLDTRAGEEMSDHLKYFTEHLPATFVYAGIDVERSGVFTGTRGRQLAGRCCVINTGRFPYGSEWKPLIAAMEGTLRLHRHAAGSLVREAKYLHQRTGGVIGSLAHLIRSAAIRSVLDPNRSQGN
jgi:hypothetical protein